MLSRPVSSTSAELVARHLKVLGQPVRVRLIDALGRSEEASVGELAEALGITVYDASQHLAILRRAGLVRRRQAGRRGVYQLVEARLVFEIYDRTADDLRARGRDIAAEQPML